MELEPWSDWSVKLLRGSLGTLVYGVLGILLAALGFKVFDWILTKIDIQEELASKQNVAVAIVTGAVILGVIYIVSTAIH
jgi:putative membrane protein